MCHRSRRAYDHRIKEEIIRAGDPELYPELEIPRSTAVSWIRRGLGEIVSLVQADGGEPALRKRIAKLEGRVAMLTAVLRLVLALLRVSGFALERARVPDAAAKRHLLGAIERARRAMPLSSARFHVWVRAEELCTLDDRPSCPRSLPQRLTYGEVEAIGGMVQSTEHRHLSIRSLALHAQRIGKVFAHPATWGKLIRDRGWGRPRLRLYPAKSKIGLRTAAPNDAWHIDVTIIRLLDGTKAYVHAVIDNFSRKVLAWTVAGRLDPMNTHGVLTRAAGNLPASTKADVFINGGVENLNGDVAPLFDGSALHRVIAQIDVSFSNSMIEAWWRSLKHRWLYLHPLDNIATVRRLVEFYVTEHNERIPHAAFEGQTPDEIYFGRGAHIPGELAAGRRDARRDRVACNRAAACSACPRGAPSPSEHLAA
jgi:putative transposase